jgi:hypothetical protein
LKERSVSLDGKKIEISGAVDRAVGIEPADRGKVVERLRGVRNERVAES